MTDFDANFKRLLAQLDEIAASVEEPQQLTEEQLNEWIDTPYQIEISRYSTGSVEARINFSKPITAPIKDKFDYFEVIRNAIGSDGMKLARETESPEFKALWEGDPELLKKYNEDFQQITKVYYTLISAKLQQYAIEVDAASERNAQAIIAKAQK